MKVLSLSLYTFPTPTTSTLFSTASDLSAYSFLTKGSVQEGLNFLSSTVASRTGDGQRQSVQEGQNSASVYRKGGVAGEFGWRCFLLACPDEWQCGLSNTGRRQSQRRAGLSGRERAGREGQVRINAPHTAGVRAILGLFDGSELSI
jgi:hypothetical protein